MNDQGSLTPEQWLAKLKTIKNPSKVPAWVKVASERGWLTDGIVRGMDFSGIDFGAAQLEEADLTGCNLDDAKFNQANLRRASLKKTSMRRAIFYSTCLDYADLTEAQSPFGWIYHTSLVGAMFERSNFQFAQISDIDATSASFDGTDLTSVRISQADFTATSFRETNLHNASFLVVILTDALLDWEQLSHAHELRWSIMPAGKRYDGRLDLPGDMKGLSEYPVDLNDDNQIAEVYWVTVEEYRAGRKWREENERQSSDNDG